MNAPAPITQQRIFRFWTPLMATWLMMAVEGPFLAAVIARMPDPKYNLAAYGVAFAFAILVEAPVIMMMSASTALVDGRESFVKLRNFTYSLNVLITVFMVVTLFTPFFPWLTQRVIGLDPTVTDLTHTALIILLPWPAAIGYRRFYQGILIRHGLTRLVAVGTVIRIATMASTAGLLFQFGHFPGAVVGAGALTAGVCAEAIASRLMARGTVTRLRSRAVADTSSVDDQAVTAAATGDPDRTALTYLGITRFYLPLALTSTISLAAHPVVTFFMGKAPYSLESLAVLPVINSLVFIFRTAGLSYQEVAITLLADGRENFLPARRFAVGLALAASLGLAAIVLTPLADVWFRQISGLSAELAGFAIGPARILIVMPALSVLLAWQRVLLVNSRRTEPIIWASGFEVVGLMATLLLTIGGLHLVGATAAAMAFVVGRLAGNGYLVRSCRAATAAIA